MSLPKEFIVTIPIEIRDILTVCKLSSSSGFPSQNRFLPCKWGLPQGCRKPFTMQCCRKPHLHGKSWRQSHLHGKSLMKRVCRKLTAMFAANLPQYSPESLYFDKDVLHVLQFSALVYSINLLLLFYFLYYYYYIFFSVFTFFIQFITKQYIHITVIYSKHRTLSLTSV